MYKLSPTNIISEDLTRVRKIEIWDWPVRRYYDAMLTPQQNEVVNHLTLIFPNHTRDLIEKTVLHLDSLKVT